MTIAPTAETSAPDAARSRLRARALLALRIAVTVALLFWLLRQVDLPLLIDRLTGVQPVFLVLGMALVVGQGIGLMATRWGIVLKALGAPERWRKLARIMAIASFFNETLPSTVGGDAVRAMMLRGPGRSLGLVAQSIALERGLGLMSLMIFALVGALIEIPFASDPTPLIGVAAAAAAGLAGAASLILLARFKVRPPFAFLRRPYDAIVTALNALGRDRKRLALVVGLSFLGQAAVFTTLWMVTLALHIPVSPLHVMAIMPGVILVTVVPISVGGWGLREGAMVVGLGVVGVSTTDALTISLLYGAKFAVFGLLAGAVWLFTRASR